MNDAIGGGQGEEPCFFLAIIWSGQTRVFVFGCFWGDYYLVILRLNKIGPFMVYFSFLPGC